MKVLHLIQRFPPAIGGAERWCAEVASYLAGRGHSVDIHCLRVVDEAALWDDVHPIGEVAVGRVDLLPGIRIRRHAPAATPWGLVRMLDIMGMSVGGRYSAELFGRTLASARRADVVHLHHHVVALSFWGFLAARMTRRPVVITPHLHPGDPVNEQRIAWWLLRRCDAVVADTSYEAERYARGGVRAERVVLGSLAVDVTGFNEELTRGRDRHAAVRTRLGLAPGTRLVTFVGRKREGKDLSVLLNAARHLAATTDLALVLVGPHSDWYRGVRAACTDGGPRIIDLPVVPEETKIAVLAASDVVVQPSVQEAFGIVFLEAWACRVPVIGAEWGAIPEVIGDAGLTFTPKDPIDLAEKLRWMLAHRTEAREMAARGHARVLRDHTWARVGAAVERAYGIALGSPSRACPSDVQGCLKGGAGNRGRAPAAPDLGAPSRRP